MSLIESRHLNIQYGHKVIIRDFSYSFSSGCYSFVGPNGCGKSSLLKAFAGLEKNYSGELVLPFGADLNQKRSYLPDTPKFYPFIRVNEFIQMVCKIRKVNPEKYLARFGEVFKIKEFHHQKLNSLSLGQMKRVFCLVTLLDECPIWILDEPSNGLDTQSREALASAISSHSKGGLVIMSEHNPQFLEDIHHCTKIPLTPIL